KGAPKPGEMAFYVVEAPAAHGPNFVDRIRELIAAIQDRDARLRQRQIGAVDVSDLAHSASAPLRPGASTPSDLSLRCKAERSMPIKAAVREMLPPKRVICTLRYSRSKRSRASRSGKAITSCKPSCLAMPAEGQASG